MEPCPQILWFMKKRLGIAIDSNEPGGQANKPYMTYAGVGKSGSLPQMAAQVIEHSNR